MVQPFQIPDNFTGPFVLPNGLRGEAFDDEQLAMSRYEELTTQSQTLADGQQRPLTPQEILFFKWLGKMILIAIISLG